jgi:hypothetical protein
MFPIPTPILDKNTQQSPEKGTSVKNPTAVFNGGRPNTSPPRSETRQNTCSYHLIFNTVLEVVVMQPLEKNWAPVAQACNPRYLGGYDQEDCNLRPAWANSFQDPIPKITREKWTEGVVQAVEP